MKMQIWLETHNHITGYKLSKRSDEDHFLKNKKGINRNSKYKTALL
jgi:hypothetical protein